MGLLSKKTITCQLRLSAYNIPTYLFVFGTHVVKVVAYASKDCTRQLCNEGVQRVISSPAVIGFCQHSWSSIFCRKTSHQEMSGNAKSRSTVEPAWLSGGGTSESDGTGSKQTSSGSSAHGSSQVKSESAQPKFEPKKPMFVPKVPVKKEAPVGAASSARYEQISLIFSLFDTHSLLLVHVVSSALHRIPREISTTTKATAIKERKTEGRHSQSTSSPLSQSPSDLAISCSRATENGLCQSALHFLLAPMQQLVQLLLPPALFRAKQSSLHLRLANPQPMARRAS